MIQNIKKYATTLLILLTLAPAGLMPTAVAFAANGCSNSISSGIASGASSATGNSVTCGTVKDTTSTLGTLAKNIVDIFSFIIGIVAVIMIIYGGFRYITSGGDSGGVGNAKNTIIFAIIGLVIVACAQLIVHFVLNQTSTVTGG